ncbi:uncharacterized protein PFL1_04411 [Pseudozyma flocculosa PF-1]|uniref:Related to to G1/S-specific cyclin n=2 Tax=Pseudozyma flocculosa TaxID=84751 RepID=A0A5C3FC74_9BASI|nr:uncharacterized protein PFL1_04411 [Pseudozyma flocculosa PF-1]EPQ28084.1 hypothetical protein PFL1_04411 [Pseudozyma flocculosa PF-1]SPO41880.1 related to to G1/S-specific cyclin [Pseudozyma flocculosa]
MPPSTSSTSSSAGRRNSFYARHHRSNSANSTGSASSSKGKSSSRTRNPSPLGLSKQQTAVLLAASTASKRSSISSTASSSTSVASTSTFATSGPSTSAAAIAGAEPRNMLLEDEYQDEVIAHMHTMETQTMASIELMDVQPELRWFMRPYLVDFLIEIHQTFRLRPETLFLTMNIVDRYVSKRIVYKRHYQLVGCAALLIAAKFEDSKDRVPSVGDLSQMCCNAYDESAFTQMEGHVLSTIGWTLGHPTAEAWLRIESARAKEDIKTLNAARFLLEASLFQREFIGVTSSALTRGALILARLICGQTSRLHRAAVTEEQEEAANSAAQMLDAYLVESLQDLSVILVKKHSHSHFSNASTLVCDWYRARAAAAAAPAGLLPAQALRSGEGRNGAEVDEDEDDDEDVEDDDSMCSRSTTPSSMLSTPSRSMDEDEDDEDEMPVTPLSLYSLHDPLSSAAAAAVSNMSVDRAASVHHRGAASEAGKENRPHHQHHHYAAAAERQQKPAPVNVKAPTIVVSESRPALSAMPSWQCNV